MECCALGEGHDITAYCSCVRTFCIAAIDGVQIARCHIVRQILQIDMNGVVLRAAVCASCIATIRLERCSVGDALDVQYIALGCCADSDIMPVLVPLRMIVAGVAAVYLGGRLRLRSFMCHLIVAETVQLKQHLVCRRIRRACSGCDIRRHLLLVDTVDLCDPCRICIVREGELVGIGDRCSCARYDFLHQCEVIPAVDAPAAPISQLGGICLDLPPVNLHSRIRWCIRDCTKSARLGEREHRIFVLEIVTEDKGIRIEIANLLRRYACRRDDQLVIFDLVAGAVKGQLRCSCYSRRHVTVVRPIDGRTCNVHVQRAGRLLRAEHYIISVRERMRCRGRRIVYGTCACDLARHRAAAHLNLVLRRRSIHLVHSTAVDIRHRAAIYLGFVLCRLAAILCGDAAINIRDAAAAHDRLVAPCLALIALSVATVKTFGHCSIVDNSFIFCGNTCDGISVRIFGIVRDGVAAVNILDVAGHPCGLWMRTYHVDVVIRGVRRTCSRLTAVCRRKSTIRNSCHCEHVVIRRVPHIGDAAKHLVRLTRWAAICAVIRPRIIFELRIGEEQSLCLEMSCRRLRRVLQLNNVLDIAHRHIAFCIACDLQQVGRRPLSEDNSAAGIAILHHRRLVFNHDAIPVDLPTKAALSD